MPAGSFATSDRQVLAPQHILPTDANSLNAHKDFARTRLRGRNLFTLQHVCPTKTVKRIIRDITTSIWRP